MRLALHKTIFMIKLIWHTADSMLPERSIYMDYKSVEQTVMSGPIFVQLLPTSVLVLRQIGISQAVFCSFSPSVNDTCLSQTYMYVDL